MVELPSRNVNVVEDCFSPVEQEFYNSLYKKIQFRFSAYVRAGTVMKNYTSVLAWLMRLRQAW